MCAVKHVHTRHFRKCWPYLIYLWQVMDSYGAIFSSAPSVKTTTIDTNVTKNDAKKIWTVLELV